MARLSQRISSIPESATLAIDTKASALLSDGRPIIDLTRDDAGLPTPPHVADAAARAARNVCDHAPVGGLLELKEAICTTAVRRLHPSNVLVTNGVEHALIHALSAICNPGTTVLTPTPRPSRYGEAIRITGATAIKVPTGADFLPTIDALDAARTPTTTALLLNPINNPTGAVYPDDLLSTIADWAHTHHLWVICDDTYATLVDPPHTPPADVFSAIADQLITVYTPAISHAMSGYAIGWLTGPTDVVKAATHLQTHSARVSTISQYAAIAALTGPTDDARHIRATLQLRRRHLAALLRTVDGLACPPASATGYCFSTASALLGRELHGTQPTSTVQLAEIFLTEAEVATTPAEAFGVTEHLRWSAAVDEDTLTEAVARIADFIARAG